MKRSRATPADPTVCEENFGALLELQHRNGLLTPPPEGDSVIIHQQQQGQQVRPSKIRRHGSRIMTALRSLTNSVSNPSLEEASPVSQLPAPAAQPTTSTSTSTSIAIVSKKLSLSFLRLGASPPTVVHRSSHLKPRPSILSLETAGGISIGSVRTGGEMTHHVPPSPPLLLLDTSTSPSTSGGTSNNSGKSSAPGDDARGINKNNNNNNINSPSTGKTSQDSKFSLVAKRVSEGQELLQQGESENRKVGAAAMKNGGGEGAMGDVAASAPAVALGPIQEVEVVDVAPEPVPTVVTVEKAASAKIFFECHYNELFSRTVTPRSLRRRELEGALYEDTASTPAEKEAYRREWARRETEHLRGVRMMKARKRAHESCDRMAEMYEVVKVLGKGSFGVVRLVREKVPEGAGDETRKKGKEVYAMKVIRKADMLRNSQEGHLRAERDFLVASEGSRWIVPLYASFQDANNLYLVMDYMPGGDFLGLLIRDNILSEAVTKWYVAEMILCIEEAHALRWIHRDVKPDNFLISPSGHLKISDFGLAFDGHWSHDQSYYNNHRYSLLAKLGITVDGDSIDKKEGRALAAAMKLGKVMTGGGGKNERHEKKSSGSSSGEGILNWRNRVGNRTLARSVVGTSQYMAPEVVKGEPYDARCDWWSVAVILYECIYGHTPFLAEEGGRAQTKLNILYHKSTFSFPHKPTVSNRCQDLIRRMIQEKNDRLCSKRYKTKDPSALNRDHAGRYVYPHDAEDIKSHRWFKDIPWDRLHLMTPPFVPAIRSADDTQYFDEEEAISDFSSSHDSAQRLTPPTEEELEAALRCFNAEIKVLARSYVTTAYDSSRLRKIEREIEAFCVGNEQKEYLRGFVRAYGRKERKRPRDKLLRDREVAKKVLEERKRGAFLGYSYRRIRPGGVGVVGLRAVGGVAGNGNGNGNGNGKGKGVWGRGRISIF